MASSGNFSTMNPLHRTSTNVQYSNGNLTFSPNSSWSETTFTRNNMVIPKDKKIYFEVYYKTQSGYYAMHGLSAVNAGPTTAQSGSTGTIIIYNNSTRINGTRTDGVVTAASQGDVIGIAIDGSNNKVWFAVNNTWQISGDPANGTNEIGTITTNDTVGHDITAAFNQNSVSSLTVNFGQDSSFGGDKTSGSASAADGNGFGDFYYTPPTGFLALSSANLSVSADIDPAQTDDDYPSKQFNAITYTGTGSSNAFTGVGFQPDLVWFKKRNSTSNSNNRMVDSSRGVTKSVTANSTAAEGTDTNGLTAFGSDGFTVGADENYNQSSDTYVAWCWRANAGTTASNSEGSTTCTVQANTKGGFSIITYTGTGSAATLGHGLEKAPEFIMAKRRSSAAQSWKNYHIGIGATKYLTLNATDAAATSSGMWNDTEPSTTLISIGNESNVSTSGLDYIIYAWHSVEGFSKFGFYEGNGNANGPFVYTGFRPRMLFLKRTDSTGAWHIYDTARNTYNPVDNYQLWNAGQADDIADSNDIDFLSNGFKIRNSAAQLNTSGGDYIYGAWGDVPFKYNNTF
jgi:hypothetical protein